MKQLLILMAFLLAVMLLLFCVMAVGNAKQSVQIADKVQQLSNLKAEMRSVQKENRTLSGELEAVEVQNRKLRWEQQAVAKQLSGLLPDPEDGLPGLPQAADEPAAGEVLLEAMAVRQTLVGAVQDASKNGAAPLPAQSHAADGRICWAAGEDPVAIADGSGGETAGNPAGRDAGREAVTAGSSAAIADGTGGETVGSAAVVSAGTGGETAQSAAAAASGSGGDGPAGGADAAACCRERENGCCIPDSLEADRGAVLAVSETITVPAASRGSTAAEAVAALLPMLRQQIDSLLHDLPELVHSLAESLLSTPLGSGS